MSKTFVASCPEKISIVPVAEDQSVKPPFLRRLMATFSRSADTAPFHSDVYRNLLIVEVCLVEEAVSIDEDNAEDDDDDDDDGVGRISRFALREEPRMALG